MDWLNIAISILTGLSVCIPLVISLVEHVRKAVKEKNWSKLLSLVMNLMQEAENKFKYGAEKKEWVLAMVKASADTINYDIDIEEVSKLIDSLCDMTKIVNPPVKKEENKEGAQ